MEAQVKPRNRKAEVKRAKAKLAGTKQVEARRCSELMRHLVFAMRARFEEALRGTAVTLPQLRLLKAVGQQQEASAASIARVCQVTPQTLQGMLARAVREGGIARGTSEQNHRYVTAALTPKGHAVLEGGAAIWSRLEEELWKHTDVEQLQTLRETLEAGLANLQHGAGTTAESPHPHR